jgi:hypothetical protein
MNEPTLETMMDAMRDELVRMRTRAIAINLVSADLLKRGTMSIARRCPTRCTICSPSAMTMRASTAFAS